jgi:hypothetical protein
VLQSLLRQERTASFTADIRNQSVTAVAPAERQAFIQQVIEQLETAAATGSSVTTQVYHLKNATAYSAYVALPSLVPKAALGLDTTGNNLLVTASAKDQEAVRSAVEQLDKAGASDVAEVKVYPLKSADPTNVVTMLQSLLRQERNATFTADTRFRSVMAAAPAETALHQASGRAVGSCGCRRLFGNDQGLPLQSRQPVRGLPRSDLLGSYGQDGI